MKLTFLLPGSGHQPSGGFKVVYEYANGLAARGHRVVIVHTPYGQRGERSPLHIAQRHLHYWARRGPVTDGFKPVSWFRCHPGVELIWRASLHPRGLPEGDAVVATAWETAEWAATYPPRLGQKYYLIQHLETCFQQARPERVLATWKMSLHKIVISRWLEEHAHSLGETADYVPNGLDFQTFGLDVLLEERDPHRLLMLYHGEAWKGSRYGIEALLQVKGKIPDLQATFFSVFPPPAALPGWIEFQRNPTQTALRALYNRAAIFLSPSLTEGWPLPPAEAAQCGAALCLTDIGGHREYAIPEQTALLSAPQDVAGMTANLLRLISDQPDRLRLAHNAHRAMQQFTWSRAVSSFERILMNDNPASFHTATP